MAKSKWSRGEFSEELANIDIQEAVGMTMECEDGIRRRIVEITHSMKWPWKLIINEQDPDSKAGHYINLLSFSSQFIGKPPASVEAQKAFERVMRIKFNINEDGSFDKPPKR